MLHACGYQCGEDGRVFEFEEFDQLRNGQTYVIEVWGERCQSAKCGQNSQQRISAFSKEVLTGLSELLLSFPARSVKEQVLPLEVECSATIITVMVPHC